MALGSIQNSVNAFFKKYLPDSWITKAFIGASNYLWFIRKVFRSAFYLRGKHLDTFIRVVTNQVRFTGLQALPMLSIIALSLGAVTIIEALVFLPKLGQNDFIGNLLRLVIIREIGPLITAIIVLARSGSAITAELCTQKMHREIDSLEMMGINPYLLIVLPRLFAGVISVMLLIIYFDVIAIVGGYLISLVVTSFPFSIFVDTLARSITMTDLISTFIKAVLMGIVIPLTCTYYGLKPESLFQIPIYVSKAVIYSLFTVFLLNAFISVLFYL
ncbi:MAG: putative phospholipid ABC transporter permease protein MlaE [Turneriella sp.]|nr:putative phospholipid ABC transporter permease protein MlaE [Turneriella sp.]